MSGPTNGQNDGSNDVNPTSSNTGGTRPIRAVGNQRGLGEPFAETRALYGVIG